MSPRFTTHDTATHAKALQAFRRRRQLKQLRPGAQMLAILTLVVYWLCPQRTPKDVFVVSAPTLVPSPTSIAHLEPRSLTDDELIAKFPPGSCFMAEVNGKKILVFKNPAVEKQFFP